MGVYNRQLLRPPDEEEAIQPYRPVWRSLIVENVVLFGVVAGAFVAFNLFGIDLPAALVPVANGLIVVLPVGLWLIFSALPERSVPEPRQRLLAVFIIAALAANAVAIPFIESVFQPERWLSLAGAINRIIGYAFTVGIVQETIKYAVVRYATWPDLFRTRLDSVAYCIASAVGYSFVLNLRFFVNNPGVTPDVIAMQTFNNVAVNVAASLIVSYGMAEVRFDKPTPFLLTITVGLGALVNGIAIPLRSGLSNAAFALTGSVPTPIFGSGFSAALLLGFGVAVAFLFNSAERHAREAAASREV